MSEAAAQAHQLLIELVQRVAQAGMLAALVERAAALIHAAGMGVTLSLLQLAQRAATSRSRG